MRYALPLLLLFAVGCSDRREVADELPNSALAEAAREEVPESRMEQPLARPVTIGEDGPRLDACGALGRVVQAGASGLALRAAPFADAREVERLQNGDRAYVCTRSIDQKWLGVVVQPAPVTPVTNEAGNETGGEPVDCGVSSPVERKAAYDGPCVSGWVSSAYIRLIAF
ncbi:hypothetical protein GGR44_001858 [Sphingobium fontiphilum]|uniref:SH3 domain-containing protein n=1 Tax=Sphingobium fontiphilum TaxID=944425 RepID=A0A7W6DNE2_9SPHN|nr:hypothetical protein [Sphingobium fontiphilum]MBB3982199.1 hypothetical protein [Sphingobium fontiphilum]